MPPPRRSPRRPTRHIITTEDAENDDEASVSNDGWSIDP
jgi:hypothetical protein